MSTANSQHVGRPFQFTILQLLVFTTVVAVVLALIRFHFVAAVAVFAFPVPQFLVVLVGTLIFIKRTRSARLNVHVLRGAAAGACLASIWFGWIPVVACFAISSLTPLAAVAAIAGVGGVLGAIIGLAAWWGFKTAMSKGTARVWIHDTLGDDSKLTDRTIRVLQLANDAAVRAQRDAIEPQHLLVGLAAEGHGVGAYVLKCLGVPLEEISGNIEPLASPRSRMPRRSLSIASQGILRSAEREALALGHGYIGTEHLLLALAERPELLALGVTSEQVRRTLLEILRPYRGN